LPQFLRDRETELNQILSLFLKFVVGVKYIASFQNWSASMSKIMLNFEILNRPLVKNWGEVGELSESIVVVHPPPCGIIASPIVSPFESYNPSKATDVEN